jgi:hypothetical protein
MQTGFIQYLFLAKDVSSFCTDEIPVTRAMHYAACPGCAETIKIGVSTIVATNPIENAANIINDGDSAAVVAEKTIC